MRIFANYYQKKSTILALDMRYLLSVVLVLLQACSISQNTNYEAETKLNSYTPKNILQLIVGPSADVIDRSELFRSLYNIEGEIELISNFNIEVLAEEDVEIPVNARRCYINFYRFLDIGSPGSNFGVGEARLQGENCELAVVVGATGVNSFEDLKNVLRHEIIHALVGEYHNLENPNSVMSSLFEYGKYLYFTQEDRVAIGNVKFEMPN